MVKKVKSFTTEKNKISKYLVPILTYKTNDTCKRVLWGSTTSYYPNLFENGYLRVLDSKAPYIENDKILAMRFKWRVPECKEDFGKYENFLLSLGSHLGFKQIVHYSPDSFTEIIVFAVPEEYYDIYNLISLGKYSELPDDYKKHILKFLGLGSNSKVANVLYKKDSYRRLLSNELECEIPTCNELLSPPNELDIFTDELIFK